jgi:hypothetical protein
MPVLTSDTADGFAFTIDVNLDGSTTVNDFSSQTMVAGAGSGPPATTPEPASAGLSGTALVCVFALRTKWRNVLH